MSEDSDFSIELTNNNINCNEKRRKLLREFRKRILECLRDNTFMIDDNDIKIINEGKFMSIKATYPSQYDHDNYVKPHLAMDFFLGNVRTETNKKDITTLIQRTLKDKVILP